MNRPSAGQAAALGGVSIAAAAVAVAIAQIELSGQAQPHIWSNAWLLLALGLSLAGLAIAVVFFVMSMFAREETKSASVGASTDEDEPEPRQIEEIPQQDLGDNEAADQARVASALQRLQRTRMQSRIAVPAETPALRSTSSAFTGLWRHTSDGFEASPLMNMANLAMPEFTAAHGQSPQFRIGVCVDADPVPSGASSSLLGAKLLDFLQRDPVSSLVQAVLYTPGAMMQWKRGLVWKRHAGNGALSLEAVLSPSGESDKPIASARSQPPFSGMRLYGRTEDTACFWLHIDPLGRGRVSSAAPQNGLAGWYRRFVLILAIAGSF